MFIVSATEPGTYVYLKYGVARRSGDVILDRRKEERRQIHQDSAMAERRQRDRRHRDITRELQAFRWAVVHPLAEGGGEWKPNGGPMNTYVVRCACAFRVQTENAEEARKRTLAQVTAAGATSVEVDEFVLCLNAQGPGEPIDRRAR